MVNKIKCHKSEKNLIKISWRAKMWIRYKSLAHKCMTLIHIILILKDNQDTAEGIGGKENHEELICVSLKYKGESGD